MLCFYYDVVLHCQPSSRSASSCRISISLGCSQLPTLQASTVPNGKGVAAVPLLLLLLLLASLPYESHLVDLDLFAYNLLVLQAG